MIFALIGNQNCGKTTLFNQMTGSNQHVGNFPGVTVDQKMGKFTTASVEWDSGRCYREFILSVPIRMRKLSREIFS